MNVINIEEEEDEDLDIIFQSEIPSLDKLVRD